MKKTLKIMLMLALVGIIGACSNANSNTKTDLPSDNKSEVKQENASIVGKWKGVRATEDGELDEQWTKLLQYYTCEFKEDGTVIWWTEGIEYDKDTYTLEGNNLTFKNDKRKYTVPTLTKKNFVRESIRGGHTLAEEFERME
jgi:hypothetical protein